MSSHTPRKPRVTVDRETAEELERLADLAGVETRGDLIAMLKDFLPDSKEDYDVIRKAASIQNKSVADIAKTGSLSYARQIVKREASGNSWSSPELDAEILRAYEMKLNSDDVKGDTSKITTNSIRSITGRNTDKIAAVLDRLGKPYHKPAKRAAGAKV